MSDAVIIALSSIVVAGLTVGAPLTIAAFNTRKLVQQANVHAADAAVTAKQTKDAIGQVNGNGDLMQMVTRVLAWQAEQSREQQMALAALHDGQETDLAYARKRNHQIINMLTIVKGKVDLMWPYFAEQYGIDVSQLPDLPYPEVDGAEATVQEIVHGPDEPQPPSHSQTPPE